MPAAMNRANRLITPRAGLGLAVGVGCVWVALTMVSPAWADRIKLRGGGQIRGKLIADPADPTKLTFVGEAGRNPIIYKKEQILQVTPEKSALDEYVVRRARERNLAEEEYQLGVWCQENHLPDLAQNHFEAALKLDLQYAPCARETRPRPARRSLARCRCTEGSAGDGQIPGTLDAGRGEGSPRRTGGGRR